MVLVLPMNADGMAGTGGSGGLEFGEVVDNNIPRREREVTVRSSSLSANPSSSSSSDDESHLALFPDGDSCLSSSKSSSQFSGSGSCSCSCTTRRDLPRRDRGEPSRSRCRMGESDLSWKSSSQFSVSVERCFEGVEGPASAQCRRDMSFATVLALSLDRGDS